MSSKKFRVAILGSGNIGTDLLLKIQRSPVLECVAFVGRSLHSKGMARAMALNVKCSDKSIQYIVENAKEVDVVFDATSAKDHLIHAKILKELGIKVIDLTPARVGPMCVPSVNSDQCKNELNINMITCGGQASIPIAHVIGSYFEHVEYIEVVSSIASKSAGPATRLNLDEYIETTEKGVQLFSGAKKTKAILNLNPAVPPIDMQTTVYAKVVSPDMEGFNVKLQEMINRIKSYVPGYGLVNVPVYENGLLMVMVRVRGLGDYLPEYAGNLDIINCAAIAMAEEYATLVTV